MFLDVHLSLHLSDDEREELIRDNTRKLYYMAATRAGQRLVLMYSGELPDTLKKAFSHL